MGIPRPNTPSKCPILRNFKEVQPGIPPESRVSLSVNDIFGELLITTQANRPTLAKLKVNDYI